MTSSNIYIVPFLNNAPHIQDPILLAFGFTVKRLTLLILPMESDGKEALRSMGNNAPLAAT
jgi:hypothetical protein